MSPEQELFDWFYMRANELSSNNTYDYLPQQNEPVEYPFVKVGNVYTTSTGTKTSVGGSYTIYIDVWGRHTDRLAVVELVDKLYALIFSPVRTEHYEFIASHSGQQQQITTDTSVPNSVFIRGMLVLTLERT